MSVSKISFNLSQLSSLKNRLVILGNIKHIKSLNFDDVKVKLQPYVSKEAFDLCVRCLDPKPIETISLYANKIFVAAFEDKVSRNNCTANPYLVTKIVKSLRNGSSLDIVIVCEEKDVLASGCAVVRAFPTFTRKTTNESAENKSPASLAIEYLILKEDKVVTQISPKVADIISDVTYGIQLASRIVDTPCNEMNVDNFIDEIKKVAQNLNIEPTIIRGEELKSRGFGGIHGVGAGAEVPPALVILSHEVPQATNSIAWVGKGIVYDTGGLCIKSKTSMPSMKYDCGGAAAVLGAFYATIKRGFNQNLHAVFCLAENAVGPKATRPDDIHKLYSGRTVEINNTDAEGRLVLADGVAYAQKDLNANIILDIATLTGAQSISTGKYHGAVMSNDQKWEEIAVSSGKVCGDLLFPVVFCPELHFKQQYASVVADMKNSCADRSNALSPCAGLFILAHLGFDTAVRWIHLDIAGVADMGERGTGFGVALLTTMFGSLSKDEYLKGLAPNLNIDKSEHNYGECKRMRTE